MRSSALLSTLLLLGACADLTRGPMLDDAGAVTPPDGDDDGGAPDGEAPSFAGAIHPALIESCQECHRAGGAASTTSFLLSGDSGTDYQTALRLIDESEPERSRLLTKASGSGHAAGAVWPPGSAEHTALLRWISEGALP